jgi:predicted MFS family arabinose efflux permease
MTQPHLNSDITVEVDANGVEHTYVSGRLAVRMFLVFAWAYLLSYAFRSINAIIAQPLVQELGLSASELGLLASAYMLSFGAMQLPVGLMLDRYGPRRVEMVLVLFAALGAGIFALAESFIGLWVGRAMIGLGVSACLMAAVKAYSLYFRPHMQAAMSSWMLVAGSMGALAVTTPVQAMLPTWGWRGVFGLASVLCVLASIALCFGLPKLFKPQKTQSLSGMMQGFAQVLKHPHFWRIVPLAAIIQGGFLAFSGLWIGPWFTHVAGLSGAETAQAMFWFSFVLMCGYLCLGWLTRHVAQRGGDEGLIMAIGMGLSLLMFAVQIGLGPDAHLWGWLVYVLFVSSGIMTYAICNKPFPAALTGRSSTALNLMIFIGAFSIQWGIGLGIDWFQAKGLSYADAMRFSLAVVLVLKVLAWLWFVRPGRASSHILHMQATSQY